MPKLGMVQRSPVHASQLQILLLSNFRIFFKLIIATNTPLAYFIANIILKFSLHQ